MDGLSLASDESIILTIQDIVINGVRNEVILTSIRLVLVESEKDRVHHEDIRLDTIGSVVPGENKFHEPTVTITLFSGEAPGRELVFFQKPGFMRIGERDQLIVKLKGHIPLSKVQAEEPVSLLPSVQGTDTAPGAEAGGEPDASQPPRPQRREDETPVSLYPPKDSPVATIIERVPFKAFPALLVIFVAVVGGMITYVAIMHENPAALTWHTTVSPAIPGAAAGPALSSQTASAAPEATPEATPQVTVPPPPPTIAIPPSGVWVRVQSPGTFIGSVGAKGFLRQVNATGDRFYQILANDGIIDISIEKQDASGDPLTVGIYKNGALVKQSNTSVPRGTIELHIPA
ncbi:MAG: hypothetical protein NTW33_09200 [Methanoregula sp.]|nr:hypothetical protein [Methanoregula sp.]